MDVEAASLLPTVSSLSSLGDSGYPLETSLMTPVAGQPANAAEARYNGSLKKTRVVVEQTIGIWKARFKCVDMKGGTLCCAPVKCGKIAAATLLLHNYCRKRNIPLLEEIVHDPGDHDPVPVGGEGRDAIIIAGQAKRRQIITQYFS